MRCWGCPDFSTSAEWDPHTATCRRLEAGPIGIGARFENVQRLAGRQSDEMVFAATPAGGTAVTYTVDLKLLGPARLAQPLMPLVLNRIADQGAAGMHRTLEGMYSSA